MKTPAVVLINPKFAHNVGGALRACACWGIDTLLWTGDRVIVDAPNVRLPREERMKGYKEVEWARHQRPLHEAIGTPVAVEIHQGAQNLVSFDHPDDAVYLFGPEDGSIPQVYRQHCHHFVMLPSHFCLNLASAVNVILYDRRMKRQLAGLEPLYPLQDMLKEHRGPVWAQDA